jgi:hypothetical protein
MPFVITATPDTSVLDVQELPYHQNIPGKSSRYATFVQASFETLLKHPTHAVTFDIHIYKSTTA